MGTSITIKHNIELFDPEAKPIRSSWVYSVRERDKLFTQRKYRILRLDLHLGQVSVGAPPKKEAPRSETRKA
jgi:hypothetical protein